MIPQNMGRNLQEDIEYEQVQSEGERRERKEKQIKPKSTVKLFRTSVVKVQLMSLYESDKVAMARPEERQA